MTDNSERVLKKLQAMYAARLEKAVWYLRDQVKLSIGIPSRTVSLREISKGKNKGKLKKVMGAYGSNRSRPGEPPHLETGKLRASISTRLDIERMSALVGSSQKVARWMELGTPGGKVIVPKNKHVLADRNGTFYGKRVVQGQIRPRPFLRRALADNKEQIRQIIQHGDVSSIKVG